MAVGILAGDSPTPRHGCFETIPCMGKVRSTGQPFFDFSRFLLFFLLTLFSYRANPQMLRIPKSHLNRERAQANRAERVQVTTEFCMVAAKRLASCLYPKILPGDPAPPRVGRHWIFAAGNRSSIFIIAHFSIQFNLLES